MKQARLVTDRLERPISDRRLYRVIELPNRLEVFLVHDPQTDRASASLCVEVGSFSDPDDIPGVAHLVEHLLLTGTDKYPDEHEFRSYMRSHGGRCDAYTTGLQTNYYFECAGSIETSEAGPDSTPPGTMKTVIQGPFHGALDRFAQRFVEPLFAENTLGRELHAVHSENDKNRQDDDWRLSQLSRSLSNPQHPYHRFHIGNLQTLRDEPEKRGVNIRDTCIEFYEKHYSANRMKLVVLGREPLDELQSWVEEFFAAVKDRDLPRNRWDDVVPLAQEQLGIEISAKSVQELRRLKLTFPWHDEEECYEVQPSRYVSHLVGHEGVGSVLAHLRSTGLAHHLSSGAYVVCPGSAFFEIQIGLTSQGLQRHHDVLMAIFQYIGMLKERPPAEWIHGEVIKMAEVNFDFRGHLPASEFTRSTSAVMQQAIPRAWLLDGTSRRHRFDEKAIVDALHHLREDNFTMMVASRRHPGDWNSQEEWYGTEYSVRPVAPDMQSQLRRALTGSASERPRELHLPHRNEFIPTRLDVQKVEVTEPAHAPKLIRNDDTMRLWWKRDDMFWVPTAHLRMRLHNPVTSLTTANSVKTIFFLELVKDALREYAYPAEIAGLTYTLAAHVLGFDIDVCGYSDKIPVLVETILKTLHTLKIQQDRFDPVKERMVEEWNNWNLQPPYLRVDDFTSMLIDDKAWFTPDHAMGLPYITVESVRTFAPQMLAQSRVEALIHGNLCEGEATKLGALVDTVLKPRSSPVWGVPRSLTFARGDRFRYRHVLGNPQDVNNAIQYYVYCGDRGDTRLRSQTALLAEIMEPAAFAQLRMQEQLGYVVRSGVKSTTTSVGLYVTVQSGRRPVDLETRIDAFWSGVEADLEAMSDERFEKFQQSLIARLLEKPQNLAGETDRLWSCIADGRYDFHQRDTDAATVRELTKQDLQDFYTLRVAPRSPARASLAVHLEAWEQPTKRHAMRPQQPASHVVATSPSRDEAAEALQDTTRVICIEDVRRWKAGMDVSGPSVPAMGIADLETLMAATGS